MLNKYSHLSDCLYLLSFFFPNKRGQKKIQAIRKGGFQVNFSHRCDWLVVSTPLKNISQIGNLPQIGVKIKNI